MQHSMPTDFSALTVSVKAADVPHEKKSVLRQCVASIFCNVCMLDVRIIKTAHFLKRPRCDDFFYKTQYKFIERRRILKWNNRASQHQSPLT